jgi:hypothetical protein
MIDADCMITDKGGRARAGADGQGRIGGQVAMAAR